MYTVEQRGFLVRKYWQTSSFKACHTAFRTEFVGRDHWGDPDVDGRIILRWIFVKWEGVETGWSWLRIGTNGGHL